MHLQNMFGETEGKSLQEKKKSVDNAMWHAVFAGIYNLVCFQMRNEWNKLYFKKYNFKVMWETFQINSSGAEKV